MRDKDPPLASNVRFGMILKPGVGSKMFLSENISFVIHEEIFLRGKILHTCFLVNDNFLKF